MRLLLFNGINLAIDKPDLLDRSLIVAVERIADNNRKDEKTIWQQFENERALLLGSIFDRLSGAIREYDNVQFPMLPRMADFARWAMADIAGQGRDPQQFLSDFAANVERQNEEAIAGSVTATVMLDWLHRNDGNDGKIQTWTGQPHELHGELKAHGQNMKIPEKQLPANPAVLGKKLREIRPNLLAIGWHVDLGEKKRPREITITRINGENADSADGADIPTDSGSDSTDSTDSKSGFDGKFPSVSGLSESDPWDMEQNGLFE
jgi:hypothetical protein